MDNNLRGKGIPLVTEGCDKRAKNWWYGHGGSLHLGTGRCVHRNKVFTPTDALVKAMVDADAGKIKFNRENDQLTLALGNPEHPGRTRGKGACLLWKEEFSLAEDPNSYKSHKRKMD
jgi:hypothetical protein